MQVKVLQPMSGARDQFDRQGAKATTRLHLILPGTDASVRNALKVAVGVIDRMDLDPQLQSRVEIVLAEVLNNVVEHAYGGDGRGVIEIEIEELDDALGFHVTDDGAPMPRGAIPEGRPRNLDVPQEHLPEGGFGWMLIRELTERLDYRRSAHQNHLKFRIPFATATPLN